MKRVREVHIGARSPAPQGTPTFRRRPVKDDYDLTLGLDDVSNENHVFSDSGILGT